MKKKILLLMGVFSIGIAIHAQIGINTDTPLALFHIDAKRNTISASAGVDDDLVVNNVGNLGLGTTTPPNKVSVYSSGTDTGLHLPNGAKSGNTLSSDISGHAVWKEGKVQYQTVVYGSGGQIQKNSILPSFTKINTLDNILVDKVKEIYGSAYGWDNANQQYIAPITGVYRIAYQVYFQTRQDGEGANFRAYLHRNGSQYIYSGIVSVTDMGSDIAAYTMGITTLNKGDIVDLRIGAYSSTGNIAYWSGTGHTFLIIESL